MRVVLSNGQMEDPLENEEQLQEQMDSLPYMCRFQYDQSVELLMGRMDPIIAAYSKVGFPPFQITAPYLAGPRSPQHLCRPAVGQAGSLDAQQSHAAIHAGHCWSQEQRHQAILLSLPCVRRLGQRAPLTAQALPCWRDS